jgi:hypothetical protein
VQAVFEFNAVLHTVLVFPHKVVLRPGRFMKMGGETEDREILFRDISEVFIREAGLISGGFIHFAIRGEADPSPPSLFQASSDDNCFGFGQGKNAEANQIRNYILEQMKNPPAVPEDARILETSAPKGERLASPCDSDDFERYRKLTLERNWNGIFQINGLSKDTLGIRREMKVLHQYLQDHEVVFAFVAGTMRQTTTSNSSDSGVNSWLGVLTDRRVLLLDHALLSGSVDTQSIRHDRIQAVSASQGWVFGKVMIDIGNRSIMIDNSDKEHVKVFARIANDWLEHLGGATKVEPAKPSEIAPSDRNPIEEIRKLAELRDAEILSEAEFASAKVTILSRI